MVQGEKQPTGTKIVSTESVSVNYLISTFVAGKTKTKIKQWSEITSDKHILECISGCKIDFESIPVQDRIPSNYNFKNDEIECIDQEIEKFAKKGIIQPCEHEPGEYISNIFTRPKKDGSKRVILNLKPLNKHVRYNHFKMDTIKSCINLVTKNCYMASIDLKDAYYSIPIDGNFQKFLKFQWKGVLYKFTCLPMGLASAPRDFTKVLKPVFAHLRKIGHISSPYLDDTFLKGNTYEQCVDNVQDTMHMFDSLGFTAHDDSKSVTIPTQQIEHLGFIINSRDMTVGINDTKYQKLKSLARQVTETDSCTIRTVSQLIGVMVAYCTGVEYGELFCKQLEIDKIAALRESRGNYEAQMCISQQSRQDIAWWISNANIRKKKISHGVTTHSLKTDSSNIGWGAIRDNDMANGKWTDEEKSDHINVLELKAVLNGLLSLCNDLHNKHIKLYIDNMTAVAYIRNMGGTHSIKCNEVARDIWEWAISRNNWLLPCYIPGILNVEADFASRVFDDTTEWMLHKKVFQDITSVFGIPDIDLFASNMNHQLERYVSWSPDCKAVAVDAFSMFWGDEFIYCFSPFSILSEVMSKIQQEEAKALVIVPYWPTQTWFPQMTHMLINNPLLLPRMKRLLTLPFDPSKTHPLGSKMQMMACLLSGKDSCVQDFHRGLKKSSCLLGGKELKNSTKLTTKNGVHLQVDGKLITCNHL